MVASQDNRSTVTERVDFETFLPCLKDMVRMQLLHNRDVHPSWDTQGYPFYRAVWTECSELLDHYGWKWWKHQSTDIDQVKLEIVDIWHFGLSMIVIEERSIDQVAKEMIAGQACRDHVEFRHAVEALARTALDGSFDVKCFMNTMTAIPMTLNELYGIYKGKHVLNRFRQANGYKEGSYQKMWKGREDNVHLAALVRNLDAFSEEFQSVLNQALTETYIESGENPETP